MSKKILKLMPLGGSITYGQGSTHGNGYRDVLHQMLASNGYHVQMVGSRKSVGSTHLNHEGWRGFRIDQIRKKATASVPLCAPDLFTINAGSNDCLQDFKLDQAGERVRLMLEDIWSLRPEATMVLSTLLVNVDEKADARTLRVNEQFEILAKHLLSEQRKIVLVDMHGAAGPTHSDLVSDGTHPNDAGYGKMARIWYKGIHEAMLKGWLT